MTSATAWAAPVVVGTRLIPAARARRKAVGRTRGVRDNVVQRRIVAILVYAQTDGEVFALSRGGDNDLFRTRLKVGAGLVSVGETASRLDHDVDVHIAPRQLGRIFF